MAKLKSRLSTLLVSGLNFGGLKQLPNLVSKDGSRFGLRLSRLGWLVPAMGAKRGYDAARRGKTRRSSEAVPRQADSVSRWLNAMLANYDGINP